MAVTALAPYDFPSADAAEHFHGARLLYIGWDDHLLFCAPLAFPFPPDMPFAAVVNDVLPKAYGYHPDFARIDWSQVEWLRHGQPWTPAMQESLAENGLGHKAVIRFRTPGLTGIDGSHS